MVQLQKLKVFRNTSGNWLLVNGIPHECMNQWHRILVTLNVSNNVKNLVK